MSISRIVVGVDTGTASLHALTWAAGESRRRGAAMLIIHALDSRDAALTGSGRPGVTSPAAKCGADRFARCMLDDAANRAAAAGGVAVRTLLSHSAPAEALIDASFEAEVLVLGTNGPADLGGSMLGTVGRRVAVGAHSPVVVVPPITLPSIAHRSGRVVVGVAGTRAGRHALRLALDEARRHGWNVTAIRAEPLSDDPVSGGTVDALLDQARRVATAGWPEVGLTTIRVAGEPVPALLDAARTAELLVLGCHHSDDPWSARLGSTPTGILAGPPCPVLLVGQLAARG